MLGINYDDLKQRHRERKLKQTMSAITVAFVCMLIFSLTCLGMLLRIQKQSLEIQAQSDEIQKQSNEILKKSMNDEQKLEKIKEMQEFMQSFIDAMQMDDDEELSPEELNNLRIILHSSTVTALNRKRK